VSQNPEGTRYVSERKPIVVMKFGGTSVADEKGRTAIAARVQATFEMDLTPVLVVSAMGRNGAPYATDTLLSLVDTMPTDPRERDLLASVGEVVSAVLVAHELRAAGIDAVAFSGAEAGILTDGVQGEASIVEIHPTALLAAIDAGKVPVIAGFQGVAEDGRVTTLGRGGSDTTACAIGVALNAAEVGIYTDVDGVMSADPRACDDAEVLTVISAEELYQLARSGARVVHTPAAELALSSGLAVRVRSTFSDHEGTLVADIASYQPHAVATAVSHVDGVARMRVALGATEGSLGHMAAQTRVYRAMADAGVSLDMFTPCGDSLVFSIAETVLDRAAEVIHGLGLLHQSHRGLSKVTLIGAGMHGVPGVMAHVAESLVAAGVDIYQVADSHTTISVLVPAEQAPKAISALHASFDLGEDGLMPGEEASVHQKPVGVPDSEEPLHDDVRSRVKERFGERSGHYRASQVHSAGEDLDLLVSLVEAGPGVHALDVATGAGHTALALAKTGADVVASDLTQQMLAEATDLFAANGVSVQTQLADALALPFADESFDVVTARMAPHHFPDPARFVREVARVLAPGGRFGLEDQVTPEDEAGAELIDEFESVRDPSHNRQLPVSEWQRIASEAGLEVQRAELLSKPVEFDWWTSIQNLDVAGKARISTLLASGPESSRAWYQPTFADSGLIERFVIPHLIMVATKTK
jgi:aspartate kinase